MQTANNEKGTRIQYEFRGSGWEYFKIWIVNIFLSIVTLYIYSAWAKVRTKRYFYGNTLLDNTAFEYHAKPTQLLLGRMIAVVLLIAAFFGEVIHPVLAIAAGVIIVLALPWVIWRSMRFNARMSSFRNVRFNFVGSLAPLYKYLLVLPFLPLLIGAALAGVVVYTSGLPAEFALPLGLEASDDGTGVGFVVTILVIAVFATYALAPLLQKLMTSYTINQHQYGTASFAAELSTSKFYRIYGKTILASMLFGFVISVAVLIVVAVVGFIISLVTPNLASYLENFGQTIDQKTASWLTVGGALGSYVVAFLFGIPVTAYFRSRSRNYTHGQTLLDGRVDLESTVSMRSLAWLMAGNLVLLVVSLGLAYPWTKVRTARFYAKNTAVYATEPLDNFVNAEQARVSALGEEIGDAFDMDVDVAI